ncbi:MAG: ABC transporter ATP-binding protein [Sedimenticola sp.]
MTQKHGEPLLELRGITKQFPGCRANDSIDLQLQRGEIHALLGENGAGKSTLVKIIYGILKADAGELYWQGRATHITNPADARRLGIAMVFQHFSLFDSLTVVENVALGMDEKVDLRELEQRIRELSSSYGLPLDPRRHVYTLSVGERQRIEIIRCLLQQPKLLVMDEPTSVLTPQEVEKLFVTLRRLTSEGVSILYISHKLDEIKVLCEHATILRNGRLVGEADPRMESANSLAAMMIGDELKEPAVVEEQQPGPVRLQVEHLSLDAEDEFGMALIDINLEVRSGEILGIAGVAGNGQAELLRALSGERRAEPKAIRIDGRPCGDLGPSQRRSIGLCYGPEERLGHASVPDMSLQENAFLTAHQRMNFLSRGFIRFARRNAFAHQLVDKFAVKCSGTQHPAKSLSGGNLQKFIIGREIMQQPDIIIISQPTWGVDAGAAIAIRQALIDLASEGSAVLIISQDLDELMTISHKVAAICAGKLSPAYPINEITVEEVGLLMGGGRKVDVRKGMEDAT